MKVRATTPNAVIIPSVEHGMRGCARVEGHHRSPTGGWLPRRVGDHPGVEVFLEAGHAVLPPEAALLHPAEGRVAGPPRGAVDVQRACTDAARHPKGALGRRAPHRAGEAVDRVVGDPDRLLLGLIANHGQYRAEA